jgi:hypothetical protein
MNPWHAERERLRRAIDALRRRQAELAGEISDPVTRRMSWLALDQLIDPLAIRLDEIRDW